eukprot:TRINITY_DN2797_c0_g1_i10.p1 TRINITY_DN2797_c0_g1~~TRINITY_DN2797_c0_g1_i10.p1  ORF type:complete len:361 (+),score=110.40 TRINITY_DN2797_c0_g1_i10:66-1148(+)
MSDMVSNLKPMVSGTKEEVFTAALDKAKNSCEQYALAVEAANNKQDAYFQREIPSLLDQLQGLEEARLNCLKTHFQTFNETLESNIPAYQAICNSLKSRVNNLDVDADLHRYAQEASRGHPQARPPAFFYTVPSEIEDIEGEAMTNCSIRARSIRGQSAGGAQNAVNRLSVAGLMQAQRERFPDDKFPRALASLTAAVRRGNGLDQEGIFRLSAASSDLDALREQILAGDYDIKTNDPYVPAALIKEILRADPIFPASMYSASIDLARSGTANPDMYAAHVQQLVPANREVVYHIVELIREAAHPSHSTISKMSLPNLAIVFSPGFLRNPSSDPMSMLANSKHECSFVVELVTHLPLNPS